MLEELQCIQKDEKFKMIKVKNKGNWSKTRKWMDSIRKMDASGVLDKYGQMGVDALSQATPIRTGLTASSWSYTIKRENGTYVIQWNNSDIEGGYNVAILIQYGHGTRSGTYVSGIDYINPAMKPIMDELAEQIWKEVTK